MTFRELLAKYQDGTLSDEEKLLVEQELEKSEAINDYLADEIVTSLVKDSERNKEISEDNNTKHNEDIERSIKKNVNRRLATIVGTSVSIVFAIILVFQYMISPLVACMYYNPTEKTSGQSYQNFVFDLRGITEVSMPGYITSFNANAIDSGFGNYNLTFHREDLFTGESQTVNTQLTKGMRHGFFEDYYPHNYFAFAEFWNDEEGTTGYQNALDIKKDISNKEIEHVKELPSTSYISAWARFTNDLTMEELYRVMNEYSEIKFEWIAVRTAKKQGQQLMGFLTDHNIDTSSKSVDKDKYPGFQLSDILHFSGSTSVEVQMAKLYETHFTSLIKYLVDRSQATATIVGTSENYDYESALNYIQENGISTYGVLLYGEAEDLLELYESGAIMTFDIDNVIASKYIQ